MRPFLKDIFIVTNIHGCLLKVTYVLVTMKVIKHAEIRYSKCSECARSVCRCLLQLYYLRSKKICAQQTQKKSLFKSWLASSVWCPFEVPSGRPLFCVKAMVWCLWTRNWFVGYQSPFRLGIDSLGYQSEYISDKNNFWFVYKPTLQERPMYFSAWPFT